MSNGIRLYEVEYRHRFDLETGPVGTQGRMVVAAKTADEAERYVAEWTIVVGGEPRYRVLGVYPIPR